MKKILYLLGFIVLMLFSGYAIYSYRDSQIYLTEGSYQGEVLNEKEGEVGLYTLNIEGEKVTLFSAVFDESYSGKINKSDSNEYDLSFEEFNIPVVMLSDKEIEVSINEEPYTFHKKSDVPIWEMEE